jgi:hypothetical protein
MSVLFIILLGAAVLFGPAILGIVAMVRTGRMRRDIALLTQRIQSLEKSRRSDADDCADRGTHRRDGGGADSS